MSATIDQRVVEMRFDNSHFENNVSKTMSTLDKLKAKLNLPGATKGLENIDAATKKVNMAGLGSAVDTVSAKFSALQVMGVTALANITNSAVNAGKNIVKSLTIDPIKTGFSEYETKLGSIQTILANTEHQGTTLGDVTKALDELNTYADKTIYNFEQMTKNIGTFTAAGVDLDTSVRSIQGIANLAAVSGSTSQQASTAMYQLSQALATGTVKLMDWNSVVNAGMGGKVFQNALIRTAAMLDGSAEKVEEWQKKNIDAYGSFRDSLTQGEWLTSEVLTRTLEQFTMAAEEGSDEWEAFKKSLMESGYTADQAEEILKMANTATDAATKVKTLTQLMDTLKESAQSGWAQTWELVVGDFEEAKAFFTELSEIFGGMLGKSADRRNAFFGEALSSNWEKLIGKINEAGIETEKFEDSIEKIVGKDKLKSLIDEYGSVEKAAREGAISTDVLKKALDGLSVDSATSEMSAFVNGLKEIERVLRRGNVGEDVKKLQTALDALGYDLGKPGIDGIIGPITERAIKEFQAANDLIADGVVGPETLAALEKAGTKVSDVAGDVDDLKSSCTSLIDVITETSGRELLLGSLMNIIKAIHRPLQAIGEAWRDVFSISPDQLYAGLEKLNKFTGSFVMGGLLDSTTWANLTDKIKHLGINTDEFEKKLTGTLKEHGIDVDKLIEKYGDLGTAFEKGAISIDYIKETLLGFEGITESLLVGGETAEKVRRTFKGLFAILDVVTTLFGGGFKIALKALSQLLGMFDLDILDVTAGLGDAAVAFRDWIDSTLDFTKVFELISPYITDFGNKIKEVFGSLSDPETGTNLFTKLIDGLKAGGQGAVDAIVAFGSQIFAESDKLFENLDIKGKDIFETLSNAVTKGADYVLDTLGGVVDSIREFLGKVDWGSLFAGGMSVGMLVTIKTVADVISAIAAPFQGLGELFEGVGEVLQTSKRQVKNVVKNFAKILKSFSKTVNAFAFSIRMKAIKELALTLTLLIGVVGLLALLPADKLWSAVGAVTVLAAVLVALAWATSKVSESSVEIGKEGVKAANLTSGLLGIAASLLLVAVAIKMLGGMSSEQYVQGLLGVVAIIGALMLVLITYSEIAKLGNTGDLSKAGTMLLAMAASLLIISKATQILGTLSWGELGKGAAAMIALGVFVTAMAAITKIPGVNLKDIDKLGNMMLKISAAMLVLTIVAKLIASMSPEEMVQGGVGILAFMGVIALMVKIVSKMSKDVPKIGGAILAISTAMLLLIGVVKLVAKLNPEEIIRGGIGIVAFIGIITLMIKSINAIEKDAPKIAGTLLAMSIAIGILAGIAIVLGYVKLENLAKGVAAVGLLGATMALMIVASKGASDCAGSIWAMAGAIAVMAAAVAAMSLIKTENLIPAVAALMMIMGMFAVVELASSKVPGTMGSLIAMAGVILILGGVLITLSALNVQSAMANAEALSMLLLALSASMLILDRVGYVSMGAIGAMAAVAIVVAALGLVVGLLEKFDVAPSLETATALSVLLLSMSTTCLILAGVGAFAPAALTGALTMCEIMAGIGAFMAILGGLVTLFPGLKTWVSEGIDLLTTICGGIGQALGSLFDGFLVGATDDLGTVAENLSSFMEKLSGFTTGVTGIDSSFGTKAKALVDAISGLMAAEFWGTISSWLPGSDDTLSNFGTRLCDLGNSLATFATNTKDVNLEQITPIVEVMKALTSLKPPGDGLFGGDGLDNFGTDLEKFGTSLKSFIGAFSGEDFSFDPELINNVITAATGLSKISVPKDGLFGADGIDNFGSDIQIFGEGIKGFFTSLAGVTIDTELVKSVAQVATDIGNIKIPEDGWFDWDGIDNFGSDIAKFGAGIAGFFTALAGTTVNAELVQSVVDVAKKIAGVKIPEDGLFDWDGIDNFGTDISTFATGMAAFFGALSGVSITGSIVDAAVSAAERIAKIVIPDDGMFGGDGIDNFGKDIKSFGESMAKFSEKIVDVDTVKMGSVITATGRLITLAASAAGIDSENIGKFKEIKKIGEGIGGYYGHVAEIDTAVLSSSITAANRLVALINSMAGIDGSGVSTFTSALSELAGSSISGFVKTFSESASKLSSVGSTMVDSIAKGISGNNGKIVAASNTLVEGAYKAFRSKMTSFTAIGNTLSTNLAKGITKGKKNVTSAATSNLDDAVAKIRTYYDKFYSAGVYLVDGFAAGISANSFKAAARAAAMAEAALEAAREALDINSPSKAFRELGYSVPEGFAMGIDRMSHMASDSSVSMASNAIKSVKNTVSRVADAINSDIDSQPTIRPVLDLSDVRNGASAIGNMLNFGAPVEVLANTGAISTMMNRRSQNGVNDDVVSAINKLQNKLDNIGNTTYQVNGVTYDDGSAVSNAVYDLARAMKIGRRV